MKVDREGRFKAFPLEWGISTNEKTGSVQLGMKFAISQYFDEQSKEWQDFSEFGYEIDAYFNLIKKDKTMNEKSVESLVLALGWDGSGLKSLQDGDWSQKCVQLTVGLERSEEYGDQLKVKWINPEDYAGAEIKKIDANAIKALDTQFGAMFRSKAPKAASAPARVPPRPPVKPAAPVTDETVNEPGANDGADEAPAEVAAPAPARRAPPPRRAPATAAPKAYG